MAFKFKINKDENFPKLSEAYKKMAAREKEVSYAAQIVVSETIQNMVSQVLPQISTSNFIFEQWEFDPESPPKIAIDVFEYLKPGDIRVWSQVVDGGLFSNEFVGHELRSFDMTELYSAVRMPKKAIGFAPVNELERLVSQMLQEIALQEDQMGWAVILGTLARATNSAKEHPQVIQSAAKQAGATRILSIDDLVNLINRLDGLRTGWAGGTPSIQIGGTPTDIFGSVEFFGQLRKMANSPANTVGSTVGVFPLTDADRSTLFRASDKFEWNGQVYHKLKEFGRNSYISNLFWQQYSPTGSDPTFDPVADDIVLAADLSVPGVFFKAVNEENGGVTVRPDDQFVERDGKIGFYARREVGFLSNDKKTLAALLW